MLSGTESLATDDFFWLVTAIACEEQPPEVLSQQLSRKITRTLAGPDTTQNIRRLCWRILGACRSVDCVFLPLVDDLYKERYPTTFLLLPAIVTHFKTAFILCVCVSSIQSTVGNDVFLLCKAIMCQSNDNVEEFVRNAMSDERVNASDLSVARTCELWQFIFDHLPDVDSVCAVLRYRFNAHHGHSDAVLDMLLIASESLNEQVRYHSFKVTKAWCASVVCSVSQSVSQQSVVSVSQVI